MRTLGVFCTFLVFFLPACAITQTELQPSAGGGIGSKYGY
jgi:hypothetical protein